MSEAIESVIDEIVDQYLYADKTNRPWIIGFSGGKDSTVLLQFVWKAIERIKKFKGVTAREIYVVCNDTMVENPVVTEYVHRVLDKIELAARDQGMPIYVRKTIPRLEDSFWVNLIGKGYPAPNNAFRWCTERLKIKPTSRFILEQLGISHEAIILIGTRETESAARAKTMKKHAIQGKRLGKHSIHKNTFIYAPIRTLYTEEVWYTLNTMESPWGADNSELYRIYSDASADDYECPTMVTNKSHKSCGQSRFGCWVCTVVQEDKSMTSLIRNGQDWLAPLLELRNKLVTERNSTENRMPTRRNGRSAKDGLGSYSPKYRALVLKRVLAAQKQIQKIKPKVELITNQELIAIQVIWYRDLIFNQRVSEIYHTTYNEDFDMKDKSKQTEKELELLKKSCEDNPDNVGLIRELLVLQKNKSLLNRKKGLRDDIENTIEKHLKKVSN